ncbi:hypothetical protein [Thiolapillus sp.]
MNTKTLLKLILATFLPSTISALAATLIIENNDAAGEGFNDPTPVAPVPGNPGTTIGEQRLNTARAAANSWGKVLTSPVEIRIGMNFDPLPCDANSANLGRAGPRLVFRDFANAPRAGTWYPEALADSLFGSDMEPGFTDIDAIFNSDIDFNNNCLGSSSWWYGIGAPAPPGTVDLFQVLLHEIAHGLGFTTFVDHSTGAKLGGQDDSYMVNLEDHSLATAWPNLTDQQRMDSATATGTLHWIGPSVSSNSSVLFNGADGMNHIQMYAPNPIESGSSVSHWDTRVAPNELMEPFATEDADDRVTNNLLRDIGWVISGPATGNNPPIPPNIYCSAPGLDIPDGLAGGVSDTLTLSDTGLLTNISIQVRANHTYVNDISATLEHDGITVKLIDRPVQPNTTPCSGFNLNVGLWDDASASVQNSCNNLNVPALAGLLQPAEALNAFDNRDLSGAWTLTISDNATNESGQLVEWCILPVSQGACDGVNVSYTGPDVAVTQSLVCNVGFGSFSNFNVAGSLEIHAAGKVTLDGPMGVTGILRIDMTP